MQDEYGRTTGFLDLREYSSIDQFFEKGLLV